MPAKAKPAASPPKPSAAKPKAAAAGASHPTYFEMIKEAIVALKDRTGSSMVAIAKHIKENHGASLPTNFKKMLSAQLRASVSKGKLVKVKASYKLSDAAKKGSPKAARSSTAKKGSPKAARSSTAKKGAPKAALSSTAKKGSTKAASSSTAKKADKIIKDSVVSIRNATGMSSANIITYIEEKHGPALANLKMEVVASPKRKAPERKAVAGPKSKATERKAVAGPKSKAAEKKAVTGPKSKAAEKKAVTGPKSKAAEKKAGAKAKISPAAKAK